MLRELQTVEVHSKKDIQQEFGFINLTYTRDFWVEDTDVDIISMTVKPWEWVKSPKERVKNEKVVKERTPEHNDI